MTLRDVHLDPDLVTDMLGHPTLTPSLHSHNICLRQTPHTTSVQLVPLRRSLESAPSQRGHFELTSRQRYFERTARDLDGNLRKVYVFRLRPVGEHLHRLEDYSAHTGGSEVVVVGVEEVPTENATKVAYEYEQVGTKQARKRETDLTGRFEQYLTGRSHKVVRYKIKTPGTSSNQFTDLWA